MTSEDARRVYAPDFVLEDEPRGGRDVVTMALMGLTLTAIGGAAVQAFDTGPAPVIRAPEGPIKVRHGAPPASPYADSAVYDAMRGVGDDEAITFAPAPEDAGPRPDTPLALVEDAAEDEVFGADGVYMVQIAALRSEADARALWMDLLRRKPALLADAKVQIARAELGAEGVVYRLRAGFLGDRETAARVCEELQAAGENCMVVLR